MKTAQITDSGLIVDNSTSPATAFGYIMAFDGQGNFSPSGKVADFSVAQIDAHNRALGLAEIESMKTHGRGVLYLVVNAGRWHVTAWADGFKVAVQHMKKSFHNFAGREGRTDVWFTFDDSLWHGVNIGDSQICRVRRCKA